jgi:hypothetical protein
VGRVVPQYRHYNRDTIDNWTDVNDSVTWKVDVMEAGEYDLILSYGCGAGQEKSRVKVQLGQAAAEYTFAATAGKMVFATRTAARMRLQRGPAMLKIQAAAMPGKEMATIHKIWFRRV